MKAVFLAFLCSFMISTGQVLWKVAIDKNGGFIRSDISLLNNFVNLFSSQYMIGGLIIYMGATIFWMYLLGKYEYSFIYPMLAIVYIFTVLYAIFLFKENINPYRWIGFGLIILGVLFISKSK